ncbi:hypothetical protein ATI61_12277 [Archangium gephyra]|uniref:Lipoprotein n=2 Tax=Archangium gephyra TaxID=48 RepID=A0ABX9JLD9_9BACT|nr:hypothetical protein ATI61_12277 [Archangium gephyra]
MSAPGIGLASLLLLVACSGFPFFGKRASSSSRGAVSGAGIQLPARVIMEVQDIQYDGLTVSARVLVSPEGGALRLDRRFIPSIDVSIGIVADCERGSVMSIHADVISALNRAENLMVLEPGYWYGRTVHFMLFDEHFTGIGPECVEATLRLHAFDGGVVARERIRAVRPPSLDGGTRKDGWPEIDWEALLDGGTQQDGGTQDGPPSSEDAGSLANPPGSR